MNVPHCFYGIISLKIFNNTTRWLKVEDFRLNIFHSLHWHHFSFNGIKQQFLKKMKRFPHKALPELLYGQHPKLVKLKISCFLKRKQRRWRKKQFNECQSARIHFKVFAKGFLKDIKSKKCSHS